MIWAVCAELPRRMCHTRFLQPGSEFVCSGTFTRNGLKAVMAYFIKLTTVSVALSPELIARSFPSMRVMSKVVVLLSIQLTFYRMYLSTEGIIAILTLIIMCLPCLFGLLKRLWRSRHKNIVPSSMLISAFSYSIFFRS